VYTRISKYTFIEQSRTVKESERERERDREKERERVHD